jgi:hypothetical protein
MKIERIELRHIKMELVSPFVTSMGTEYDEEHITFRQKPGIGVEVNMEMLNKVTMRKEIFKSLS